jgi:hypothetical protein
MTGETASAVLSRKSISARLVSTTTKTFYFLVFFSAPATLIVRPIQTRESWFGFSAIFRCQHSLSIFSPPVIPADDACC